jgi:hypothetical protein
MAEEKPGGIRQDGEGKRIAAGLAEPHQPDRHMIPVWFFVGLLLLTYGILIFIRGITEYSHPPDTVLANLHAPIWWGGLLIVMGAIYVYRFWPRKKRDEGGEG